jgi:hypothetical protein
MLNYILENDLLFHNQSVFLPGHSTEKQLMNIVHMILENSDNRLNTRAVFLDIAGAFDAVPHHLLLLKLSAYQRSLVKPI